MTGAAFRSAGRPGVINRAVYGTIVVLAALAAGATAYQYDLWRLGAIVSASVLILWIAYAYAHALGESLRLGRRLTRAELTTITGRELAIPLASVLPLAMLALGALRLVRDVTAIWGSRSPSASPRSRCRGFATRASSD